MRERLKRIGIPGIVLIALAVFFFNWGRYVYYRLPQYPIITPISKIVMAVILIIFAVYMYVRNRSRFNLFVLISLIIHCIADVLINLFSPFVGIGCFLLGHIVFLIGNLIENRKLNKVQILLFAIGAAVIVAACILTRKLIPEGLMWPALIYALILMATLASAFNKSKIMRVGYSVFVFSDILLVIKTVLLKDSVVVAIVELGLYYLAIILITIAMAFEKSEKKP